MKRYIEIVYDNSGSMNDLVGKKRKYEIAQELFEKEILPTIGLRGDYVVLRLLRKGCIEFKSTAENLPNHKEIMLDRIRGINHNQSTPLFYTVYDAVEACKDFRADEYLIFVLTDGDDTCGVKVEELIDKDSFKKYVSYCKVLLVQLAVNSKISKNNLTSFTNALGGQTISLENTDSISQMRKKLKSALNISGFSNKFPLEHCFDKLPGADLEWEEIEFSGINYHQALLLYHKELLSWEPKYNTRVNALQFVELRFLFALLFKTGIPEELLKTMLTQLKKPYYYSFDCVYWDFAMARWRYFIPQNKVQQLPNDEAELEDFPDNYKSIATIENHPKYFENITYRVKDSHTINSSHYYLIEEDVENLEYIPKLKILNDGDLVVFKKQ